MAARGLWQEEQLGRGHRHPGGLKEAGRTSREPESWGRLLPGIRHEVLSPLNDHASAPAQAGQALLDVNPSQHLAAQSASSPAHFFELQ